MSALVGLGRRRLAIGDNSGGRLGVEEEVCNERMLLLDDLCQWSSVYCRDASQGDSC